MKVYAVAEFDIGEAAWSGMRELAFLRYCQNTMNMDWTYKFIVGMVVL